jgi:EAL domain-containing protein (putative c-di-GMP-specific phosphodiesterase class I)
MVRSLIVLAQELGMNVIVEGIENEAQLRAIQEIGANEVQGYFLGHPSPDPTAYLLSPGEKDANDMNDQMYVVLEKLGA